MYVCMYRIHNFHSKFPLEPLYYIYITPQATAVKAWGPIAKVVRRGGQPVVNFIASLYASEATAPVFFTSRQSKACTMMNSMNC